MKNKMQMLINIIAQPNILLLDEPLTSLDVVVAEEMKQLLRSLKQNRITIFSTHIMDLALDLCDEIVLLNHGVLEVVEKTDVNFGGIKQEDLYEGPGVEVPNLIDVIKEKVQDKQEIQEEKAITPEEAAQKIIDIVKNIK